MAVFLRNFGSVPSPLSPTRQVRPNIETGSCDDSTGRNRDKPKAMAATVELTACMGDGAPLGVGEPLMAGGKRLLCARIRREEA